MKKILTFSLLMLCVLPSVMAQPAQKDVVAALELANDYFLKKYPDPGKPTFVNKERPSNLWTRGVYFEGLIELAEVERMTGGAMYEPYRRYIYDWGEAHEWTPRKGVTTRDADDYCCCQTYLDMGHGEKAEQCGDNLIACRNVPQKQGNGSSNGSFGDWTWIDAIHMGLPVMTKLSQMKRMQGDPNWVRYAEQGWQMYRTSRDSIAGGLFNRKQGLWWRDKDFVPPFTTPNGKQCYWSRGNGWVYSALVRAMESLPQDPHYMDYMQDYLLMTKALLKCQQPDGYWYASLDDPRDYGGKELTGTALFIYGMAWGVRNGVLSATKYCPIIYEVWDKMVKDCLHPDGALGYVQGTGKEPKDAQPVTYDKEPDFDDYGLGCFLLCGTEIVKLLNR
jgi:rhamnogalacturonyl hydrolase YesR